MAQNIDECKELIADVITKIGEVGTLVQEVKEWADGTQATMAELIGTESEVFRTVLASSEKADVVAGLVAGLGVEAEYLQEHLTAIS
jgi:hypothetical protein